MTEPLGSVALQTVKNELAGLVDEYLDKHPAVVQQFRTAQEKAPTAPEQPRPPTEATENPPSADPPDGRQDADVGDVEEEDANAIIESAMRKVSDDDLGVEVPDDEATEDEATPIDPEVMAEIMTNGPTDEQVKLLEEAGMQIVVEYVDD